jgi:predicted metal-dependent peptidase
MSAENEKLRKARTQLVLDHPFFGTLACYLEPREDREADTLSTDGRDLRYNPIFVRRASMEQLRFAIAHVVQHLALDHFGRRQGRRRQVWDLAADHAANLLLAQFGVAVPPGVDSPFDPAYSGKPAEEIFSLLARDWPRHRDTPRFDDHPTELAADPELRSRWKERTARTSEMLRRQGLLPGAIDAALRAAREPRVDWRRILLRFILQTARFDYSYARCNRRYASQGLYVPGLKCERIEDLVVALDTSASISDDQLSGFLGEVGFIASQAGASWKLVTCDSAIQDIFDGSDVDPARIRLRGRGGTSFRPVFEWIERHRLRPAALVYLTDAEGEFPGRAPGYPVLWALTGPHPVPFGESLVIPP